MSDRILREAAAIVAAAGLALAAYLTWAHYEEDVLVCSVGAGCETVQESDYATLGGVPVALLGTIAYGAVLALLVLDTPPARTASAAIAAAALAFSLYLLALQAFVIDAWCAWCLVNDVMIAPALALTSIARLIRRSNEP